VLLAFCRFSGSQSLPFLNGLFVLEITPLAVAGSFLLVVVSISWQLLCLPAVPAQLLPQTCALHYLLILASLGSILSGDLLSFALFFEGASLFALALALCGTQPGTSPYQHVLYFLPSLMVLGFVAGAADGAHEIGGIALGGGLSALLALVLASRVLFFPFGWPALKVVPSGATAGAPHVLLFLPTVAVYAIVKFLPQSGSLNHVVLILAGISTVAFVLLCYRRKEPSLITLYSYLAQTATVVSVVVYGLSMGRPLHEASFLVLGNHVVSSMGMLLCLSGEDTMRGRFGSLAHLFFVFCMLGLPPSPGFFGRLELFNASLGAHDLSGYLLRFSFLANLFVVYCQSKQLAPVIERVKKGERTPARAVIGLGLLVALLVAGMVFLPQLRPYLSGLAS
jgi:formate hydrogenlyase subunit 3/multisubunit Na+/H+ antiporter MnhD subunit